MQLIIGVLSILVFVSVALSIYFRHSKKTKYFAIFKPLTTILIISIASIIYYNNGSQYSLLIIIGLLSSLIGDIFLIGEKHFLQGLSSFLIAHIAFTFAFINIFGFQWNFIALIALLVIGIVYYKFLFKYLGKFKIPVAIYISVILIMNWQAIGLMQMEFSSAYIALGIGSLLFSFSDAVISYNKFVKEFRIAEILILSTYWMAIYIFAVVGYFL